MKFTVIEALNILKKHSISFVFHGCSSVVIKKACAISNLENYAVSFLRSQNAEKMISEINKTQLLILRSNIVLPEKTKGNFILTDNPDLAFRIIANLLNKKQESVISDLAYIDSSAVLGKNVSIGAFSSIGKNVVIGNNCIIDDNCSINNAVLGDNIRIQPGVRIGSPGLGSKMDKNGVYHDFPHFGKVIIGENVKIQDNVVINRGTLNNTVIENNSRIGPLTWIGHGVKIEKSCFIFQSVTIAGSVTVGRLSKIYNNATVRDGVVIGVNCVIGMGAVVTKNIPNNETWFGNPAKKKE